ncbi:MAG TPA: HAD-IIB family hydrolase [Gammaproteobacteria bacterium]|nr:HAD-IIB family hydrolase [Gammaproteobacteria bacterium]
MTNDQGDKLYIQLISVHGLIRGHNLELGRDADTGGQVKYVVELARALAEHPEVERVDLLTRQVIDPKVDADYAEPIERIGNHAYIVRLPCGPRRYLRKEVLWPHLDSFADQALKHVREVGRVPDIIHSHYADAGYVGARLAGLLGAPLIHTGHSLGREKRRRLEDRGAKPHNIEKQYNISQRIEAEEWAMDSAILVIASTTQEVEEQYSLYDNYHPKRMRVIPPGTDLSRFRPPRGRITDIPIYKEIARFLRQPRKPMILALSRADERKNIGTLIRAYGENQHLQELANLVVVAGNRDDIAHMNAGPRKVLNDLLLQIDRYDLYGRVAYPKHHASSDVPDLYQMAAHTRGVFVNPALTEPFGLTLIEAAASHLPVVATEDGGPRDIQAHCKNGILVDPLDADGMGEALLQAVSDGRRWRRWADAGLKGAYRYYSWGSHVESYLKEVHRLLGKRHRKRMIQTAKSRLPTIDRLVVCGLDDTLLGDRRGLNRLLERLHEAGPHVGLGIATGRSLHSALQTLKAWSVPLPDLLITSVGAEIYYGRQLVRDTGWDRHIDYRWEPERLRKALKGVPGLRLQPKTNQHPHKISYYINADRAPKIRELVRHMRSQDLHAKVVFSHGSNLDLLPIRACKGQAVRYLGAKWGLWPEHMLVAGDSGNDLEMLRGNTLGVVVGNHHPEIRRLKGEPRIYFAEGRHAWGILEGIDHYDFLGTIHIPGEAETEPENELDEA